MGDQENHPAEPSSNNEPLETTPLFPTPNAQTKPYSAFTKTQKRLIVATAALAATFSPLSANIYFPALNSIAKDLNVSPSQINLTITTYMIFQGLAPTFTGSFADQAGRRPAYIFCFAIYISGNICLALQHWFSVLLLLRAVQSCGSSGTVALASAVTADIVTAAERGTYMGLASLSNILAPSLGPIAGGLLSQYLGWQAIFWFLAILSSVFFIPWLLFFPETCRNVVGDGSIPPGGWNRSLMNCLGSSRSCPDVRRENFILQRSDRRFSVPSPWSSLKLIFQLPVGVVLLVNGLVFGSYYAITAGIPAHFATTYHLNDLQVGLCYIPAGLGSLFSATVNGKLVDWNYKRFLATSQQLPDSSERHDLNVFPIERVRLQIGFPMTILSSAGIALYGILAGQNSSLWVVLLMVFFVCFCITAAYNVMNVLITDLYYETPATAMAANNLVRCFIGAGAAAIINPLIDRLGIQCTYCIVSGVVITASPLLILVYRKGEDWRRARSEQSI
ncbi:hypothetical protein N7462_000841 [Penicillium macrosclerotiorum]|uniref:uncharacterized protein n=1 Tax=Penicillium macrosclerotiorum TaxID=303699 RepID=UPI002546C062|nr:uncharacterized protein N7462_000841 [Penicillium macrosclerotiorum]KAJ5698836.1 hypothetical protein N7462_000841 [Penicillium macrosclerotiorum]